jgi:hypothetical protein
MTTTNILLGLILIILMVIMFVLIPKGTIKNFEDSPLGFPVLVIMYFLSIVSLLYFIYLLFTGV